MFIALQHQYLRAPAERHVLWPFRLHAALNGGDTSESGTINMLLQRSAMCFGRFVYMPLLTERDTSGL
jgi:hypothetical protein